METKELTKVQLKNRIIASIVPQFDESSIRQQLNAVGIDDYDIIEGAILKKRNKWMKANKSEIERAENLTFDGLLAGNYSTAKKLLCDYIGCSDLSKVTPYLWSIDDLGNLKATKPESGLSNLIDALMSEKTAKEQRNKLAMKQAERREDYNDYINLLAKEFVTIGCSWADLTKQLSIAIEKAKIEFGKFETQKKADKERLINNYWHSDMLVQQTLHELLSLAVSQKKIDMATADNKPVDDKWKRLGKAKKAKLIAKIKQYQSTRNTIKVMLSK